MANNKLQSKRKFPEMHSSIRRHRGLDETPLRRTQFRNRLHAMRVKEIFKREFNIEVRRKMLIAGFSNKEIKHAQYLREGAA